MWPFHVNNLVIWYHIVSLVPKEWLISKLPLSERENWPSFDIHRRIPFDRLVHIWYPWLINAPICKTIKSFSIDEDVIDEIIYNQSKSPLLDICWNTTTVWTLSLTLSFLTIPPKIRIPLNGCDVIREDEIHQPRTMDNLGKFINV